MYIGYNIYCPGQRLLLLTFDLRVDDVEIVVRLLRDVHQLGRDLPGAGSHEETSLRGRPMSQ